jgi:hypothetical protein
MKPRWVFSALLLTLFAMSCASNSAHQGTEAKPKHAARVQVAMYDTSPRAKSDHMDIFDETRPIQQPHKDVALLTCEGTPREEAEMTEAIIYRARLMGANAIIILPPSRSGWGDRRVFRAKAVTYDVLPK